MLMSQELYDEEKKLTPKWAARERDTSQYKKNKYSFSPPSAASISVSNHLELHKKSYNSHLIISINYKSKILQLILLR